MRLDLCPQSAWASPQYAIRKVSEKNRVKSLYQEKNRDKIRIKRTWTGPQRDAIMCQRNTDEILFGDRTDCTHETQHPKRKDIEKKMIEKVLNIKTVTVVIR